MVKTVSLATGLALGYVLGARAGRARYEQLVTRAQQWAEHPTVTRARERVSHALSDAAERNGVEVAPPSPTPPAVTAAPRSSGRKTVGATTVLDAG